MILNSFSKLEDKPKQGHHLGDAQYNDVDQWFIQKAGTN